MDSKFVYSIMFTSLRSRLWLSYALLITVALTIVSIVLFVFLIRNPLLTRQTQQQLKTVQSLIAEDPKTYLKDPDSIKGHQEYDVRSWFQPGSQALLDSNRECCTSISADTLGRI
jgi:hypothetical protein